MSLRRSKAPEDQLLDDSVLSRPSRSEPRVPRRKPPGDSALVRLMASSPAMGTGDEADPPSQMQPPEDRFGYGVAAAAVFIGVLFCVVHSTGHPKHTLSWLELIGGIVVAGVTPIAIFRVANRFLTAILVVIAAFLISLVRPPTSWIGLYYVLLVGSLGYAFWLTRHQSKAARAAAARNPNREQGRGNGQGQGRGRTTGGASGGSRPKKIKGQVPVGPTPNRRYTPPLAPRERPKRSEAAAPPPPPKSRRKLRRADKQASSKDI